MDPRTLSDDQFLAAFQDCSMPAAGFDHQGHVRAAWILLRRYPCDEAVARTCDGIARLASHLGAADKYHRTLSEALVRLIAAGDTATPATTFDDFLRANTPLMQDARALLARHYSPERLADPAAKMQFLPPDRLPLPPL
jgi:hypothetical protein